MNEFISEAKKKIKSNREREREKITWLQMCQREREMIVLCVRTRDGSVCERQI